MIAPLGIREPGRVAPTSMLPSVTGHMDQLDGLRALAILAVLWAHWMPPSWSGGIQWGHIGVELFFVLSGFLITGILLDARARTPERAPDRLRVIRQFYIRRVLRIFPLFYATLFIAAMLGVPEVRDSFRWHAAYLSNVYFFMKGQWHGPVSHFWSLAVEEQFYLFWPWLILLLPTRLLPLAMVVAVAVAPPFRFILLRQWPYPDLDGVLVISCLDALAIGGILAWLMRFPSRNSEKVWVVGRSFLAAGVGVWLLLYWVQSMGHGGRIATAMGPTCIDMVAGWIVVKAAYGFRGWMGRLLLNPCMRYLGKISYGIYMLHLFVPVALLGLIRLLNLPPAMGHGAWRIILESLMTVGLAAASWHFFESPINNLKRYFPYRAASPPPVVAAPAFAAAPGK